jgi:hypothetical protein
MGSDDYYKISVWAFTAFERGLKDARSEMSTNGLGGAITALQSAIEFANSMDRWRAESLSFPLTALLAALHDLDSGRVSPMVQPKPGVNNRRPAASWRRVQRAVAIFCIEQLVSLGMSHEQSAKFVAVILKKGGMPIGGRSNTPDWRTVGNWRYDASRGNVNNQEASVLAAFRAEHKIADGTPKDHARRSIERSLLNFLRAWSPGLG